MTIEEQIDYLNESYASAEQDAIGDYGEEVVDSGGWYELVLAVCDLAPETITEEAKREWKRMQGVESR